MADRIYPRMAYHYDWPAIAGQVIQDVAHDMRMGNGWDDPYSVRSADVIGTPQEPKKNKGGRPRKVIA